MLCDYKILHIAKLEDINEYQYEAVVSGYLHLKYWPIYKSHDQDSVFHTKLPLPIIITYNKLPKRLFIKLAASRARPLHALLKSLHNTMLLWPHRYNVPPTLRSCGRTSRRWRMGTCSINTMGPSGSCAMSTS